MPNSVLEASGLSKRYRGGTWALRDIDLSLAPGGIVGLVGPNGAGKSTLLKLWVGFERASMGTVSVLGADPWRQRRATLSRVGYLAQTPALYRDLRVADHLDFVSHYRGSGFDRALAAQRLSDLRVPLNATAGTLSGGQAAQLGLAIALGLRAEILLLDEPLASLDPLARREFIDVLTDGMAQSGATAVLSSHIVSDLERACGRLVVLRVGKVQLAGRVDDILAGHAICMGRSPDPEAIVATLPGGSILCRVTRDAVQRDHALHPASLDDIVLGHLVAGREAA
jgi:ABC-2 type transport system ATP-binding protein